MLRVVIQGEAGSFHDLDADADLNDHKIEVALKDRAKEHCKVMILGGDESRRDV